MSFIRAFLALLALIQSALLAFIPLLVRRGTAVVERARREDDVLPCLPIPAGVWLRPDAYLYSQPALMALGIAVTWDNPDVRILDGAGNTVGSHDLLPSTTYRIQATIHNRSTDAPAPGMPVIFAPAGFGAGAPTIAALATTIDLPVRAAPGEPALAEVTWTTPSVPGHYCIVITAIWPDDANPIDNVGQHNTVIRDAAPGERLIVTVPVFNPARDRASFVATVDSYVLPREPILAGEGAPLVLAEEARRSATSDEDPRLALIVTANARDRFPAPAAWHAMISPPELDLEPGGGRDLDFEATVPVDAENGSEQRFNIVVTDPDGGVLLGGVTVVVRVR